MENERESNEGPASREEEMKKNLGKSLVSHLGLTL